MTAEAINAVRGKSYEDILNRHIHDHKKLFDRVALYLGESKAPADMPTDRRIAEFGSSDPGLVELLFHYGRYLLIASSRPGTQALIFKAYGMRKRGHHGAATIRLILM